MSAANEEWQRVSFDKDWTKAAKLMFKNGASTDDVIEHLHVLGVDYGETVLVINQASRISWQLARQHVDNHPIWRSTAEASRILEEEFFEILRQQPNARVLRDGSIVIDLQDE